MIREACLDVGANAVSRDDSRRDSGLAPGRETLMLLDVNVSNCTWELALSSSSFSLLQKTSKPLSAALRKGLGGPRRRSLGALCVLPWTEAGRRLYPAFYVSL